MGEELNKAVTAKKTKKRWFMLFLLFILTAINYLDRTNMAVAAPSMSSDLGFDAATMGLLFSAFAWSYGLMQIPGGWNASGREYLIRYLCSYGPLLQ